MLKFNLILSSTKRSFKYLKILIKNNFVPEYVIIFSKKECKKLSNILKKEKINFSKLRTDEINDPIVVKKVKKTKNNLFIYSGYPGQIIQSKQILKRKILHAHPGSLYDFKGSTTLYYSLILKNEICCSVLRLNKKIDSGDIYFKKKFALPKGIKIEEFENNFDNDIRISTIIDYLNFYSKKKDKVVKKSFHSKSEISSYYVCHPIIRGLAFNKRFY